MNIDTFESVVRTVVDSIPGSLRDRLDNVTIEVVRRPSLEQDPTRSGLLGLYDGVPILERGFDYYGVTPDRIFIFYEPHLKLGLSDDDLRTEIRTTVLHEIGHHLGISDDRLTEIGWD